MSWIDIIIVGVFAFAVVRGLRQGIIGQLGSLAAFVLALIACRAGAQAMADAMGGLVPDSLENTPMGGYVASILGGAIVYGVVYYLVRLAARFVRTVIHALMLGPVDRALGAIFSVLKWGVGLSVVLNLWLALFPKSDFVKESTIGGGIAAENLMELAPWAWGIATHGVLDSDNNDNNGETTGEADTTDAATDGETNSTSETL